MRDAVSSAPLHRPDTVLTRRMVVLKQMVKNRFITAHQYDSLKTLPLGMKFQRIRSVDNNGGIFPSKPALGSVISSMERAVASL